MSLGLSAHIWTDENIYIEYDFLSEISTVGKQILVDEYSELKLVLIKFNLSAEIENYVVSKKEKKSHIPI